MILSVLERELRLQKQILSLDDAGIDRSRDAFTDSRFVVMLSLIGGVNAAKPISDGRFSQTGSAILFPCRAVEKLRNMGPVEFQVWFSHHVGALDVKVSLFEEASAAADG